ncbi:MAG: prephenate dehydrogenase/arogenate dehydrogenase family protein [Actinobacteria bacterium]|nr:prephenate dehydrogenase/arogenate dehydrogenase family protein [Actinomycetota bacterium]
MKVVIAGAGFMGTSLGMAITRAGGAVRFTDLNREHAELASARVGSSFEGMGDLFVAAVPTTFVGRVILEAFKSNLALNFTDLGSTKTNVQLEVSSFGVSELFCGGHPMAGSERSGPTGARSDLFEGRPWVITPSSKTSGQSLEAVRELVALVGALPVELTPEGHDRAVAEVSHGPQVLASLLASSLNQVDVSHLSIAGQGLRDTTRIAGSSPEVWASILSTNGAQVATFLEPIAEELALIIAALKAGDAEALKAFISRGNAGRDLIPGKHGLSIREYDQISVVLPDRPGQLALLFDIFSELKVNVEDISMEHSLGLPAGLIQLSLQVGHGEKTVQELIVRGWRAFTLAG